MLGRRIEDLAGRSIDELLEQILDDPRLEDLVHDAVDAAASTAWDEKREALARVVAAAIAGDDTTIDGFRLVELALLAIDRPHAHVLALIARHGITSSIDLGRLWPDNAEYLPAVVAVLSANALVRNTAVGTWDGVAGEPKWVISALGLRLLALLGADPSVEPTISFVVEDVTGRWNVTFENVGPVDVHAFRVLRVYAWGYESGGIDHCVSGQQVDVEMATDEAPALGSGGKVSVAVHLDQMIEARKWAFEIELSYGGALLRRWIGDLDRALHNIDG